MIPTPIDDIPGKLAALETSLVAAMPTRHVFRGCEPYEQRTSAQLTAGVINLLLDREHDYAAGLGRTAREGTLKCVLVAYLLVDENTASKADLQDAEAALAEELKSWIKAPGIDAFDLRLDYVQLSRQVEHPYGWLLAGIDLGPPRSNVY